MTDLLTRLEARKKRVLRHDWYKGLKCPECGYDADRQKCAIDAGGYCRAQDQDAHDEIPDDRYIVTPDKDCADAAAEIRKLNEAIRHQAAAVNTLRECETTEIARLRKNEHEAHRMAAERESLLAANSKLTEEVEALSERLRKIGDLAHDKSTGPAVLDGYWEIRNLAYEGV